MSNENRADKNQVFAEITKVAALANNVKTQTSVDSVKAEFGLEVPVESIPLPSLGIVYSEDHPLHAAHVVDISSMTAREEDILTSQALIKKGTVITELIKSCLINKMIDPASLIAGDRNALMVSIRITGYGAEYDGEVKCSQPECQKTTNRSFDLSKLEIQRLKITPDAPFTNLFSFELPRTKKKVQFKYLTGYDEDEISISSSRMEKAFGFQEKTSLVTTNLLHSIVSLDGVTDRVKISKFISMMPAGDSSALRKYIRDNEPGIKMKLNSKCPACGNEEEVAVPMGVKFLWPNAE